MTGRELNEKLDWLSSQRKNGRIFKVGKNHFSLVEVQLENDR